MEGATRQMSRRPTDRSTSVADNRESRIYNIKAIRDGPMKTELLQFYRDCIKSGPLACVGRATKLLYTRPSMSDA